MNFKRVKLTIPRKIHMGCFKAAIHFCLLMLFCFHFSCKLNAATANDSLKISDIATYSGASNDPFLSLIYLPCFNLPSLNRFPFIIRGSQQSTNAVFIDSVQIDYSSESSTGNNLTSAAFTNNGTFYLGKTLHNAPYFFDGYRSWFNGSQNASVSVTPSFASVDQGGGAGANVFVTHNNFSDKLVLKAIASYSDASLSIESPVFTKNIHFGLDGRFGYNNEYIKNWIEPYTSSTNVTYNFPLYGDFGAIVKIENVLNSIITLNFKNTFERLSLDAPSIYYTNEAISNYQLNFGSARISTRISEAIENQFKFGYSNMTGEDSIPYENQKYQYTVFNLSDEISFNRNNCIQSYLGIQVKNMIGREDLTRYLSSSATIHTSYNNDGTTISPFTKFHLQLPSNQLLDIGLRIDKYKQLNSNSGSLLYLSSSIAAKDSAPFDLTYRLRFEYPVFKHLSLLLETGTYNQSPTAVELYENCNLPSIKSSKHALSFISIFSDKLTFQSSLYYHSFWNLPLFYSYTYDQSNETPLLQPKGECKSKGFECTARYHPTEKISCLLGYSLSNCEENDYTTGKMERQSFDRLNKITGHVSYSFPYCLRASAGLIFTTGVPITPVTSVFYNENFGYTKIYGNYNSATGKDYFTLNCRIDYSKAIGRVELSAFVEGKDLLKSSIDKGYNYDYSSGGPVENIDTRSIDFGLAIRY